MKYIRKVSASLAVRHRRRCPCCVGAHCHRRQLGGATGRLQDGHRHRHRQPAGPLVQPAREHGPQGCREGARIPTRVYETKSEARAHPEHARREPAGYNLIFAVGFLNYSALNTRRAEVPEAPVRRDRRGLRALQKKPKNAAGQQSAPSRRPATSSATSPGSGQEGGWQAAHQRRRSHPRARDRPLHQRLHPGREEGEPEDQGARELRERHDLQRPGEVRCDRAISRSRRARRSSSRWPAAAVSAR